MHKCLNKIWHQSLVFNALLLLLATSAAAQNQPPAPAPTPTTVADSKSDKVTAALLKNAAEENDAKEYRIGVGDEIAIEVFRHPEYSSASIKISENGLIVLPRINEPVQAVCKTENQLTSEISELYKNILRQPFVRVRVLNYQSQPVAVIGAVEKAGQLYLNRKMRLMQVVALAGGPNKEAGTRIQVARLGVGNVCAATLKNEVAPADDAVELSQLLSSFSLKKTLEGDEAANPWMQPGNLVYISEADKAFVIGNVKEPQPILLKTPLTLTQAIAASGGI